MKGEAMKRYVFAFIFVVLFFMVAVLNAGTTGKLAGRVTDVDSGEPVIGANVLIIENRWVRPRTTKVVSW